MTTKVAKRSKTRPRPTTREEWLAENPLRVYLGDDADYGAITNLARKLMVLRQTIYPWLRGTHLPSIGRMRDLQRVTGIEPAAWLAWQDRAPNL